MKWVALISFLLGMATYLAIPKDSAVLNPQVGDYYQVTAVNISDGNPNCVTYIYGNAIGKNLMPMQKVSCK